MIINIGTILGGPEMSASPIDRMIGQLIRFRGPSAEARDGETSLDIEFHVPGSILDPEHTGVRRGRLSRKQRRLAVQIAVPREILDKGDLEIAAFLVNSVREAVRMAASAFSGARIPFDESESRSLVDRIERGMRH